MGRELDKNVAEPARAKSLAQEWETMTTTQKILKSRQLAQMIAAA